MKFTGNADAIGEDAYLATIDSLLQSWESSSFRTFLAKSKTKASEPKLAVVHGLAAHTHVVAGPARDLLSAGHAWSAMPLVRLAYECALTAQWVAQTPDGAQALMNSDIRKRAALVETMGKAAAETFQDGASSVAHAADEALPSSSNASARSFEQLCRDLRPGGDEAYVYYRVMSQMSHASVMVCDNYLALDPDDRLTFRLAPKPIANLAWLFTVAASLVWAGRAIDYFDKENRRRSDLRRAAKTLQIPSELHLSDEAWLRLNART
jgi:hypothetical protein